MKHRDNTTPVPARRGAEHNEFGDLEYETELARTVGANAGLYLTRSQLNTIRTVLHESDVPSAQALGAELAGVIDRNRAQRWVA